MTYWRVAGLNYLRFSSIAARVVRSVVKVDDKKSGLAERDNVFIKQTDGLKDEMKSSKERKTPKDG